MRTTVELSDRTYRRLRATAAERGMRGFSPLVEKAVERMLEQDSATDGIPHTLAAAEGAWTEADVKEWERSREEAWASWPDSPS